MGFLFYAADAVPRSVNVAFARFASADAAAVTISTSVAFRVCADEKVNVGCRAPAAQLIVPKFVVVEPPTILLIVNCVAAPAGVPAYPALPASAAGSDVVRVIGNCSTTCEAASVPGEPPTMSTGTVATGPMTLPPNTSHS